MENKRKPVRLSELTKIPDDLVFVRDLSPYLDVRLAQLDAKLMQEGRYHYVYNCHTDELLRVSGYQKQ